jgi:predicted kinase
MSKRLIILRGVPGSGKSSYQRRNYPGATVASADHFFATVNGYRFDARRLSEAHATCFRCAIDAVQSGANLVVIDNTAITAAEAAPYVLLGQAYGYDVQVITLLVDADIAAPRNVHGVPAETVQRMAERLQKETLPPWWNHQEIRLT